MPNLNKDKVKKFQMGFKGEGGPSALDSLKNAMGYGKKEEEEDEEEEE